MSKKFILDGNDLSGHVQEVVYSPGLPTKHHVLSYGHEEVVEGLRRASLLRVALDGSSGGVAVVALMNLQGTVTITTSSGEFSGFLKTFDGSIATFVVNEIKAPE